MTGTLTGLDLPRLQKFFDNQVPGAGQLRAELISGGRSNLTYLLTDGRSSWVLRRPPLGGLTPSAHDVAREYRIVAALRDTGVPVARAVAQCDDPSVIGAPFAIVEYVPGRVLRTQADLDAFGDADVNRCATSLIDTLVGLHTIDPNSIGLGDFGRAQGYLGRQVRRWYDQWTRVATREVPDIETLHNRLAMSVPEESDATIVHGDFRIDNTILDPADIGTIRAIVDWEMATLGDPVADLALHLVYRDPAFDPVLGGAAASTSPRMPAVDDLVQRYTAASGRHLANLPFALALGYFKSAVIAEGIHARHLGGHTVGTGFDAVGEAVPALAAAGLAVLREPGLC